MRRARSCHAISGLACWLLLCSLLPASAAQPANDARNDTLFSLPTADPTASLYTIPVAGASDVPAIWPLAQNTPRLYSVKRVGIEPQKETEGPPKWQWSLATGYRQDDLSWNIGGNIFDNNPPDFDFQTYLPGLPTSLAGRYVNILSELAWTDVTIAQLEFGLQRRWDSNLHLEGQLGYGIVVDGKVQDSDYVGDNRTLEFSRSNNGADKGDVWDVSVALGYDFSFVSDMLGITPLFGLSYHAQNFYMVDGVQTVSNYGWPTPLGPFAGLDSSYDADWFGPWTGADFSITIPRKGLAEPAHRFLIGFEWHFYFEYRARADWNLRSSFAHPVSFEHETDGGIWPFADDGGGWVFTGGYSWFITPRWALDLRGKYQKWETDSGEDRTYFYDGTSGTTPLNKVKWDSFSTTIGISCRW